MVVEVTKPKAWDDAININYDQLWSQIRKGEGEALSRLFCMYYEQLFNYGLKIVPNTALIKDCIQELFLVLWDKRNRISKAHTVKSYLFCSIRRIIFRKLTKQKNRENRNQIYKERFLEEGYNAEEFIIQVENSLKQKNRLSKALDSLSGRQKEAISLKFFDGLSNDEIAYVMGINQQSVYNHVSKAINKLQKIHPAGTDKLLKQANRR